MAAFVRGRTIAVPPPREWMVEATNRCNLACPMCGRDKVDFARRDMDFAFFERLLAANPHPEAVWPYGFGEPLMHPGIFEFIRHAKRKGIVLSLSTNGTLLTEKAASELIDSGLGYLIVAFDGATPETYAKHRKGADFHRVRANVDRLLAMKLARRSRLHVTLQMILLRDNSSEISAFKKMWTREGVDRVRIREDLTKFPEVARIEARAPKTPLRPRRPCFFLWRGPLFIQAAGTVIPCPYYHGSEPFGDLNFQTVDQAWNSKRMAELRRAHARGDLSQFPVCARCPRHQPHRVLAALSFFVNTPKIRELLPVAEDAQRWLAWKLFE